MTTTAASLESTVSPYQDDSLSSTLAPDDWLDYSSTSSSSPPPPPSTTTEKQIPPYVCCVVTEGVWTIFFASLLIFILVLLATLKYCHKRFAHPKFLAKNQKLLIRYVMEDEKGAVSKIRSHAITVADFPTYYDKRCKYSFIDRLEFTKMTQCADTFPVNAARDRKNLSKNQSQDAIPYDYNRVKLKRLPGSKISDYVNASYVKGYKEEERTWIVTQGPMENTLVDFWQLVWQERVPAIVMLTKTFEFIKVMCVQYWPLHVDKVENYGDFKIVVTEEECYSHFKVRYLTVEKDGEKRQVVQYQYTEWPAYAKPAPNSLINFRRRLRNDLRNLHSDEEGSEAEKGARKALPLIHCNDGGSRSGTYIAIDMNLLLAEDTDMVDIFGTVRSLHEQRRCLVASPDDFRYIYDVVEDHLLCGETFIPTKELLPRLQAKSKRSLLTGMNEYQKEHRLLSSLIPRFTIGDCAAGHRAENRMKNRNSLIVPPDNSRPYLTPNQNEDSTDYINAVFVDGYMCANELICTEWPTSNTITNFWSLVHDHNIKTMVVLNHPGNKHAYPQFWPVTDTKHKYYGQIFCIQMISHNNVDGKFSWWDLRIIKQENMMSQTQKSSSHFHHHHHHHHHNKKEKDQAVLNSLLGLTVLSKQVRLFQIHCWPPGQKVPNSTMALVHLIDEVEKWRGHGAHHTPRDRVLVVSTDGYSRCGIYCTAAACLEQIYHRQEVDVFQAVKTVRKSRPQLVHNPMEYKYCYDVVLHYVLNYCRPE